jgi:hypothetical protein
MISRPTSLAIASAYTDRFTYHSRSSNGGTTEKVYRDKIYDFLYEQEYEAWFCNLATKPFRIRDLKEWFMKIHTGESFSGATKDWSWEQRQKLGQRYLRDLASDHLRWFDGIKSDTFYGKRHEEGASFLQRRLELDGYLYRDGRLLQQHEDVLDVEQEQGILQNLFKSAKLGRTEDAFEFLRLAEEHFVSARWSDSISNVRKFFELTLREGAKSLSIAKGENLSEAMLDRPVEVRQYLEREGLFERKERESLDKIYGLLSETGAHPYMAESDQARLLRQLSLTLSQFALLRLVAAVSSRT